ncbi:hypothetical protein Q0T21_14550 [Escherichia coli O25:H4]
MTTITRENAEIKSFITGFLSDPAHDNQSSNSLLADVFRIALASLEAEPVAVNDDMAYAFHHALSDSSLGADEVEEIKTGLRAAFANVAVQPALIVPAEIEPDDSNTFDYVDGWNACRAAMLQGKDDGILTNEDTKGDVQVRELTMLIKQLVSQLRKAKPDCKLPEKAMDYLKRNGLTSVEDILR